MKRKNRKDHNFKDFSNQEKEKLKIVRQELVQAQKKNQKASVNTCKLSMMG